MGSFRPCLNRVPRNLGIYIADGGEVGNRKAVMKHWGSRLVPVNNSSLISLPERGYFCFLETKRVSSHLRRGGTFVFFSHQRDSLSKGLLGNSLIRERAE